MECSQVGIDLIKSFEGCCLKAYQDMVGVWSVGYGHTGPDVVYGLQIGMQEALDLLDQDVQKFALGVTQSVTRPISQCQFDALVSFAYNLGIDALRSSTLLRCVNKGNFPDAAQEFLKWGHAGGVLVPGLVRRREAEKFLFLG